MADAPNKIDIAMQPPAASAAPSTNSAVVNAAEDRAATQKQYDSAKKELRELLIRKKQADKDLAQLEAHIYKLEGNYLEDTQQGGNIVRGFDGYLKGLVNTRKSQFSESDRLFSLSSVSYSETAQPIDKADGTKQKKRRKTMEDGSDSDGSIAQYPGTNKRARVNYAD